MKINIHMVVTCFQMIMGTVLTAAAFGMVIIPRGFAVAGVTGFSKVLTGLIPIPLSLMVLIVNMILFMCGFVFVGKEFAAKTVVISLLFPATLEFFMQLSFDCSNQSDIICIIIGGIMLGSGVGLILRSGASCGGFDIFAVILNKKFNLSVGMVLNICDAVIIMTQALTNRPSSTLYGILVITVSARVANLLINFKVMEKVRTDFSLTK